MPFADLLTRLQSVNVRNFTTSRVPGYVLSYLNFGCKFVPDSHKHSAQHVLAELPHLRRKLNTKMFFLDKPKLPMKKGLSAVGITDWSPPADRDVDRFCRDLQRQLIFHYQPRRPVFTDDWFSRKAKSWLRAHASSYVIVDLDKNLGDGIFSREWIKSEIMRLLFQATTVLTPLQYYKLSYDCYSAMDVLVQRAIRHNVLKDKHSRFLFSKIGLVNGHNVPSGSFRARVKIHKNPFKCRPIANLRGSWISPISSFVCVLLKGAQAGCKRVIQSSMEFVTRHGHAVIPKENVIVTIDAKELYPSISQPHLLAVLEKQLLKYLNNEVSIELGTHGYHLACVTLGLVREFLRCSAVSFDGSLYLFVEGIPTGLSCATLLANIYLDDMDCMIFDRFSEHLTWQVRFVDDACFCLPGNLVSTVCDAMTAWHPSIVWEVTGQGRSSVPFLDLELGVDEHNRVSFSTFRKAQNAYLYLPRSSCHPESVFDALIIGECHRLRTTCSTRSAFQFQLRFFREKLAKRGYDVSRFRFLVRKALQRRLARRQKCEPSVYLRCKFSRSVNVKGLRHCLRSAQSLFSRFKVGLCFGIQRNMFRRLYRHNWPRGAFL